ncbi:hypothetical protein THIARS_70598 [Thiomonas delicata]|uniref:Uncharacterized protein n=1 Tax=Thiomonas delicata TaxID=364030 RepID=A0A238D6L2_THIDL|nr:hypothetical protein THIARS_70598 [Thiomonas delicata]
MTEIHNLRVAFDHNLVKIRYLSFELGYGLLEAGDLSVALGH